jgi:hypothetical protein
MTLFDMVSHWAHLLVSRWANFSVSRWAQLSGPRPNYPPPRSAQVSGPRPNYSAAAMFVSMWVLLPICLFASAQEDDGKLEEIAAWVRSARGRSLAPTQEHLERARQRLTDSSRLLDRVLHANGKNGGAWRQYLQWDAVTSHLANPRLSSVDDLAAVLERISADHIGLERAEFLAFRKDLRTYVAMLRAATEDEAVTDQHLQALESASLSYHQSLASEDRQRLAFELGWLEQRNLAPDLVAAVRSRFSAPNLFVTASDDLLQASLGGPVVQESPVRDVILGTRVFGTGTMVGVITVRTIPSSDGALLEFVLRGNVASQSYGYNGPVRARLTSTTEITGTVEILVDGVRVEPSPAKARGVNHSQLLGLTTRFQGPLDRIVRRIALRRSAKQQQCADFIAARHAERDLRAEMNGEAREFVKEANEAILREFRAPLLRLDRYPTLFQLSTSDRALDATLLQAAVGELGAPGRPPARPGDTDLVVRMHETYLNNLAQAVLAGRTVDNHEIAEQLSAIFPSDEPQEQPKELFSVTFAETAPLEVTFGDAKMGLVVRGQKFISGKRAFPPMDIMIAYGLKETPSGTVVERLGVPEAIPPRLANGEMRGMGIRETALRRALIDRLDRDLPHEVALDSFMLPLDDERSLHLKVDKILANAGWFLCGLEEGAPESRQAEGLARQ